MALDERTRHALHTKLLEVLGTASAEVLMEELARMPDDVARAGDIAAVRGDLETLRGDLETLRGDTNRGLDTLRGDLTSGLGALRGEMNNEVGALRSGMDHGFQVLRTEMEAMEHRLTAVFRGELVAAVTSQTRTIVFALLASQVTLAGLIVAASRILPSG
ncbi:hypothetical protein BH20ACT8_BH20ACT8_21930 [soil metagenome]